MGDAAATSPLPLLVIIVCTLTFEGMVYGADLAEKSFPTMSTPADEQRDCDGLLDGFVCGIQRMLDFVVNLFLVIGGVVAFFFNLVTFNVPGAPWFIRLPVGATISGGIVWSLATLFRGN